MEVVATIESKCRSMITILNCRVNILNARDSETSLQPRNFLKCKFLQIEKRLKHSNGCEGAGV